MFKVSGKNKYKCFKSRFLNFFTADCQQVQASCPQISNYHSTKRFTARIIKCCERWITHNSWEADNPVIYQPPYSGQRWTYGSADVSRPQLTFCIWAAGETNPSQVTDNRNVHRRTKYDLRWKYEVIGHVGTEGKQRRTLKMNSGEKFWKKSEFCSFCFCVIQCQTFQTSLKLLLMFFNDFKFLSNTF